MGRWHVAQQRLRLVHFSVRFPPPSKQVLTPLNTSSELFNRWMREINPTHLGNVASDSGSCLDLDSVTFKKNNQRQMWAPNKVKQEPFLSHSVWGKLFSPLFWHLCSREEENRRDAGNATIQAEPCDGRRYTTSATHHCARHPAAEVIHSAQSAARTTTCEHKHRVYNETRVAQTMKMQRQKNYRGAETEQR